MKWELILPQRGDAIRVKSGNIWHFGVFVGDDMVVQFGANPVCGLPQHTDDVEVMKVTADEFLQGGFMEVGIPNRQEKRKMNDPEVAALAAESRLGQKGYDILHNNCEHFVNECVFGEHKSTQVDSIVSFMRRMRR